MLEIPGFRYDPVIKNYMPVLSDTPANRSFNVVTAKNIIKYERVNNLKRQIKSSQRNILQHRNQIYPCLHGSLLNIYNINKYQQMGVHNITNNAIMNLRRLNFLHHVDVTIDNEDDLNNYHNIHKCFPPYFNSQLMVSSYSPSPLNVYHSLYELNYRKSDESSMHFKSKLIKRFDHFSGVKLSVDCNKVIVVNKKEFITIDKETKDVQISPFIHELPIQQRCSFDTTSEKMLIGINSKNGITHLASYDLSSNNAQYEKQKCDWDRKWVFRDVVYDANGSNFFLSLRGRMNNTTECILQQDWRCPLPSQKNIRRLSLNFHQHSSVHLTRVPTYTDLIITHCMNGRCELWDMRWKDRPVLAYQNIAPGKPDLPITVDPTAEFVTVTDNDSIVRVFNLKTGLILYSDQLTIPGSYNNPTFSFYSHSGLFCKPSLLSNIGPDLVQICHINV